MNVRPGRYGNNATQSQYVENDDPYRYRIDGLRQRFMWVMAFCCSGANQFDACKGENCNLEASEESAYAIGEDNAICRQVAQRGNDSLWGGH
ncbi:hypothetical protein D3C85_1061700 [compost metagenome]